MGRFTTPLNAPLKKAVSLGPCQCPGTPHPDGDVAEIYLQLGWDDLVDIGSAATEGASQRILTTRAIASWNLEEHGPDGKNQVVPIVEATVRLLDPKTLELIAESVAEAYERTKLPNAPSAESPRLPVEQASSDQTSQTPASPTS